MRQKSMSKNDPAERTVRDIRRKTRKQYTAEEKIRIVVSGLRGDALLAAQAQHHDPDLLLSRILLACLAANIPNRSLRRVVLAH